MFKTVRRLVGAKRHSPLIPELASGLKSRIIKGRFPLRGYCDQILCGTSEDRRSRIFTDPTPFQMTNRQRQSIKCTFIK